MKRFGWQVILAMIVAAGSAAGNELGIPAQPLEVAEWVHGEPVKIEPGKVYVVEFWATWCPPCLRSIPHLNELQEKYADDLVIIGMASSERVNTTAEAVAGIERFFEENPERRAQYRIAVDKERATSNSYMNLFGQTGIPCAFVIDRERRIVWVGNPLRGLDEVVAKVIAGEFKPAQRGDAAPALQVQRWLKGDGVELSAGKGEHFYLVDFWHPWREQDDRRLKLLSHWQQSYRDKGLVVVGVLAGEDEFVDEVMDALGGVMDYAVAQDHDGRTQAAYCDAYAVTDVPHTFIVDRQGRVIWHGDVRSRDFERAFRGVIEGDFDVAAGDRIIERNIRLNRQRQEAFQKGTAYVEAVMQDELPGMAVQHAEDFLKLAKDDPEQLTSLADYLMNSPNVKHRDKEFILKLTEAAVAADAKDTRVLVAHAAALAINERYDEAAQWLRKGMDTSLDRELVAELARTLQQYEELTQPAAPASTAD